METGGYCGASSAGLVVEERMIRLKVNVCFKAVVIVRALGCREGV